MKARLAQRALRSRGWYDPSSRSGSPGIIIGGCGRSGTTVFKEILNRHPRIACGPESSLFGLPFDPGHIAPYWEIPIAELRRRMETSRDLVHFAESFYEDFARREGKARWADKTPNNVRAVGQILTWFPNARFIHVVRDGRDVVCSLRNHPRERVERGRIVPVTTVNPIGWCCGRWVRDTSAGRVYLSHPRCLEVRYEDLVTDPEREIRRVCSFIGEDFVPEMISPSVENSPKPIAQVLNNPGASRTIVGKSVGRWRRDLSREERSNFVDIAGELLVGLGYVSDHRWVHEGRA